MIQDILRFPELLKENKINFNKTGLKENIQDYAFIHISENTSIEKDKKQKIDQNIDKSHVIIISESKKLNNETNKKYLIIGFYKTILILEESSTSTSFVQNLLSSNIFMAVCFLPNKKTLIKDTIQFENQEFKTNNVFEEEIKNFIQCCCIISTNDMKMVWSIISPCISGYFIKESYLNMKINRIERYIYEIENDLTPETIDENEFIILGNVGVGSFSTCSLIYHIKRKKLYVTKSPTNQNDIELTKLVEREESNYMKIKHPFIPKFYGKVRGKDSIVIEFINGKALTNINEIDIIFEEKFLIVFEILIIFKYFHDKGLIYRDLKPNNVIIDENNNIILIDFDRLIEENTDLEHTLGLNDNYSANEINKTKRYSYKTDIYSIGKMIEYIMIQNKSRKEDPKEITKIQQIIQKCIDEDEAKRPSITELIEDFCSKFQFTIPFEHAFAKFKDYYNFFKIIHNFSLDLPLSLLDLGFIYYEGQYVIRNINKAIHYYTLSANKNFPKAFFYIGTIYYENRYVKQDIEKAIHYYTLAADQNLAEAQFVLGNVYREGRYITRDINKAIHYYTLAANQNIASAHFNLALIYDGDKYTKRDMEKAIHHYTIAANQNLKDAQFNLGNIYHEGKYVKCDINKAIYYYTLAANQNSIDAQYNLGNIYYEGIYVTRDIVKAIHYFTLAANHNLADAQLILGLIYYEGKYVKCDVNKAIHFYTLAASQNLKEAQFNLGNIFHEGRCVKRDINKAIYYYTLAANQNLKEAQFNLGYIYDGGQFVTRDIKKAIHYYTLAANQNFKAAQFYLGYIYYSGLYIPRDINKAIYYYTLAANQDFTEAQFNIGFIYYEGKYIKRDINKSIYYCTLAANKNDPRAQSIIGLIYYEGKYVKQDINKAIRYFTQSANQNNVNAQFNLGIIYYEGRYVSRDITKSIHYFTMAANQNHPRAQFDLGFIYYEGRYIKCDINKAIHYFTLASNKNLEEAYLFLGNIFYEGKFVKRDINKAIHYYSLSANHNLADAQFNLGLIYYERKYVAQDINKAIHYFTLAANQNLKEAQFYLGIIFCDTRIFNENIKKGIYYLVLASKNGEKRANFCHGFLLHEGKNIKRDIKEAINYYKEASSFNIQYAKNNLGIIYKHGFDEEIEKNSANAIVYFEEAIRQKNDYLSMYNLAHLYIYDEKLSKEELDKPIELLIKSSEKFYHSMVLLCILFVIKFGFDINNIKIEIEKRTGKKCGLLFLEYQKNSSKLSDKDAFKYLYESYRNKDFVYNIYQKAILTSDLGKKKDEHILKKNISSSFYDGFGYDLLL